MFHCWEACSFQPHLQPRWVRGSSTDPRPSRSRHHPSAVSINVKLHPSPTGPPSPTPPSPTLHISLAFQSSINVISSCACLHYDTPPPSTTTSPSSPSPFAPTALSFSFLFHLCSISLPLSRAILRESFPLFSLLRNHTIGLATSVCFWVVFFPFTLPKTTAIRDARREGEFNTQIAQRLK